MSNTCTYQPTCDCAKCAALTLAVEAADCDFGMCGDCPRCIAEEQAEQDFYAAPGMEAGDCSQRTDCLCVTCKEEAMALEAAEREQDRINDELSLCYGDNDCACVRCDAEREMEGDEELRRFSVEGRDEQDASTFRWWLCGE